MSEIIIKSLKTIFKFFGVGITKYNTLQNLRSDSVTLMKSSQDLDILKALKGEYSTELIHYLDKSKSQLRQDLFVLNHFRFKKGGFFVEFGAANGYDLSNTYLMEKEFGWNGILAEPATIWHSELKTNRRCNIETNCVWKDSASTLAFNQVEIAELSTINSYSNTDSHIEARRAGKTYSVKTISLNDLLSKYNAPQRIDYLSVDTEGSEYEILSNFDFSKHTVEIITCEHNYTPMREKLYVLLTKQGYQRVFENLSRFDDWYIKSTPP